MKKISIITFAITAFIFVSCNNSSGTKTEEIKTDKKASVEQVAKTEDVGDGRNKDGKVINLTKEIFIEKVWNYEKHPDKWVYEGDLPCMIDFYADWCKPCKMVAPIMDELAEEYKGQIYVYKIDTQVERELAQVFQVTSIPRVLFVPKDGQPQMSVGALPKPTFVQAIEEVLLAD
jgi:thioredoxin